MTFFEMCYHLYRNRFNLNLFNYSSDIQIYYFNKNLDGPKEKLEAFIGERIHFVSQAILDPQQIDSRPNYLINDQRIEGKVYKMTSRQISILDHYKNTQLIKVIVKCQLPEKSIYLSTYMHYPS